MAKVKASSAAVALVGEDMAELFRYMNPDMIIDLAELVIVKSQASQQQKIETLGLGTRLGWSVLGLIKEHTGDPYGKRYIVTDKFQPVADAAKKIVDHLEIHHQIRKFING